MKIGDVIRDESPDTDLIFYTIITCPPNRNGHYEGIQVVVDKRKGLHSASANSCGDINELAEHEFLLTSVGTECSVCRRPEYAGHPHEHVCE